jgi:hypothetical protein
MPLRNLDSKPNDKEDSNLSIPPGFSFRRSKLEFDEEGRATRTFYDETGAVLHIVKGPKPYYQTNIDVSFSDNPKLYARIYYRNIRRYRDGNKPRLPDISQVSQEYTPYIYASLLI